MDNTDTDTREPSGAQPGRQDGKVVGIDDARLRMGDHIVRGTAANGRVRALAITARDTVQTAHEKHSTSSLVTAALGRLMMAGQMMGVMFKEPDELITLAMHGDGPIGGLTVTANTKGQVKGFANHPNVWLDHNADDHLDVGGGIGKGTLTVVRDDPGTEPYTSTIELVSGEVGDDITKYFVESDQIPTSVGVGVLVGADGKVQQAGGFIIQLMPGYDEALAAEVEDCIKTAGSVTELLKAGMSPDDMLHHILLGLDYEELEAVPAEFYCGCSKERALRGVISLGVDELKDMVAAGEPANVHCHFCGKDYGFSTDELQAIVDRLEK